MAEKVKKQRFARIRQMVEVYRNTKALDPSITWLMLISFFGPIIVALVLAFMLPGGWLAYVLWPITGILVGILVAMIVLGRRAERAAYRQISGQPGAVGAIVQGALRRSWRGSEVPVALNRHQDAIYRVVGRGGVVIISEGSRQRTQRMAQDEERKVKRALRNVDVTHLYVGPDEDAIPLERLSRTLLKLKPKMTRREVGVVFNRLASLQGSPVGIPKGIDPNRVRSQRPR